MNSQEIVTRGDLPHWYVPGTAHFVTYRLANTIPAAVLRAWRAERQRRQFAVPDGMSPAEHRLRVQKQVFAACDRYLDANIDRQWLADPRIAAVVRENLYHHNGVQYELLAYCIMPNHVHVLLQPFEVQPAADHDPHGALVLAEAGSFGHDVDVPMSDEIADSRSPLSKIMHSLKSYTANRANEFLNRRGQFWQHESYDHWVRNIEELERIVYYIRANPVSAGLCLAPQDWQFSSAFDRFRLDGCDCAMVGKLRDDWRRARI